MTSTHTPRVPEDQPFDPEALQQSGQARRNSHESQVILVPKKESSDGTLFPGYDPKYPDTGYNYQYNGGTSDYSLVDNKQDPLKYQNMDYSDPFDQSRAQPVAEKPTPFSRALGLRQADLAQRIDEKKRGVPRQAHPIVVWVLSLAMLGVLIYELVLNKRETGDVLSFKPVVNPMLGPTTNVLINAGARFPPCMKLVQDLTPTTAVPCLNNTVLPATQLCSLDEVCGFGGFHDQEPNQWFRFITPIFLHAGIVHFVLNMLAQMTVAAQVEREMGSAGFTILYFAAGIFGNVFGGNFSLVGVPSVGASGAIFGTVAVAWIDLLAHWKYHWRPVRTLVFMIIELVIGIAIGFIPYVDNFAHIGGFLMGLLVGMVLYPIISASKRHRIIVWTLRLAALALAIVLFVVLIRNFYKSDPYAACSWCRYLSCIPTSANNHCKGTGFANAATGSSTGTTI